MNIRVWRDDPKRGETNARWCASASVDGHVVAVTTGHESMVAAWDAIGGGEG
jgi:hypothetical protein